MPVKLGIVGFGRVAQTIHLEAIEREPRAELVAIADSDSERRAEAARRLPSARVFADYHDLLQMDGLDAAMVCLPSPAQAQAAIAAFDAGRHAYVEKPIATRLEDGRAVVDAWRRAGTVGMAGLNYRLHPHYRRAREVVASGALGELVGARSVFSAPATLAQPAWKRSVATGGGALLDFGSHHADLVQFLLERRVLDVFATSRSERSEDDTVAVQLRLEGSLLVQSLFSLSAIDEERFEVYGDAGKLTVDRCYALDVDVRGAVRQRFRLRRMARAVRNSRRLGFLLTRARAVACEPSYALALGRFVKAIETNRTLDPDVLDGCRSLAVVAAAEASLERQAPVAVDPILERAFHEAAA